MNIAGTIGSCKTTFIKQLTINAIFKFKGDALLAWNVANSN